MIRVVWFLCVVGLVGCVTSSGETADLLIVCEPGDTSPDCVEPGDGVVICPNTDPECGDTPGTFCPNTDPDCNDEPELDCPRGGPVGDVEVRWVSCSEVYVWSCKDLSNVVIGFEDFADVKTEDVRGTEGSFRGEGAREGATIDTVWVKAGRNHSGDGPGYGERFDRPDSLDCDPE